MFLGFLNGFFLWSILSPRMSLFAYVLICLYQITVFFIAAFTGGSGSTKVKHPANVLPQMYSIKTLPSRRISGKKFL